MGHEVDLKNFQIRTDLAIESIGTSGIKKEVKEFGDVKVTSVFIDKINSTKIGKKVGHYITIEFSDVTDFDNKEKVKDIFAEALKEMFKKYSINDDALALIIGLGNDKSTPDALGPLTINKIIVTNHLFLLNSLSSGFRRVCAISPGVTGQTGIETSEMISSVIKEIKPDFVITVDALASGSIDRVNKTIQMTDAGITPGSGVGNHRKEISKELLGVPVFAIGVPTVVDAVTIVSDTFNYMYKHYSYTKRNIDNPFHKLVPFSKINYLKENDDLNDEDKNAFLGMVGTLSDNEIKQLIYEVLTPIGYNLMVTPKEIDFVMEKLSDVIGNGINKALHKNIDNL